VRFDDEAEVRRHLFGELFEVLLREGIIKGPIDLDRAQPGLRAVCGQACLREQLRIRGTPID